MKKVIMLLAFVFFALHSNAKLIVETCIEDHVENSDCYKIQVTIINDDPAMGRVLVSQGSTWVGKDCAKLGKTNCNIVPNPHCPPIEINGETFCTSSESPHCIGDYMQDNDVYTAYIASRDELVAHASTGGKGLRNVSSGLAVYPNPAHGYVTIATRFEDKTSSVMAYLYDVTGREVFSMNIANPGSSKFTVVLKDVIPGYYNVVIRDKSNVIALQKLLVQ